MAYRTLNPFTEQIVNEFGRELADLGIMEFVNKKLVVIAPDASAPAA